MPDPVTRSRTPDYGYIRELDVPASDGAPTRPASMPRPVSASGDPGYIRDFDGDASCFTKDGYVRELPPPAQKSADAHLDRGLIDAIRNLATSRQ